MPNYMLSIKQHLKNRYDIQTERVQQISVGVINANYLIKTSSDSYIFKIYYLRDEKNVAFELSIITYLATRKFPCPRVISDNNQRLFSLYQKKPAVLLRYIPGKMISDITPEQMGVIGKGVGTFHTILQDFEQSIDRVTWEFQDIERHIKNESKQIIKKKYPEADEFVAYVAKEFTKLNLSDDLPKGMTHQDIKPENIIIDGKGNISFIDFNDCYRGTLLIDVMTLIIWACFKDDELNLNLFKSYLSEYNKQRLLTRIEQESFLQVLLFRLLRETFVWPMRFSPEVAFPKSDIFLRRYKRISSDKQNYGKIISSYFSE